MWKNIIYLILIILITMFLTYLGCIKEKNLSLELTNKLYSKCCTVVIKYLKNHEYATIYDIQNILKGVTASVLWSKKRVQVQNPLKFARVVTDGLYSQGKISIQVNKNNQIFSLKETKE